MNKDIKEDWIEALRSGEYVQSHGKLDGPDGQCCLGVLCDILDLPFVTQKNGLRRYLSEDMQGSGCTANIPIKVAKQVKLSNEQQTTLIELNDQRKATFEEIADYIEVSL